MWEAGVDLCMCMLRMFGDVLEMENFLDIEGGGGWWFFGAGYIGRFTAMDCSRSPV